MFWYTGRDSNPQPSEPESDALSIEPPVHLHYSLVIIASFWEFVKGKNEIKNALFSAQKAPSDEGAGCLQRQTGGENTTPQSKIKDF